MGTRYFGASVARVEDPRLLRGSGRFVDDIKLPGLLHAALVRSPHAHARITAVQLEAARALPGVAGVFGYEELAAWMHPMPSAGLPPPALEARLRPMLRATPQLPLARERVRYVGEPVAIVVARNRAEAEDAAELVNITYESLPVSIDTEAAVAPEAPRLFPDWPDNVAVRFTHAIGDADTAIRAADVSSAGVAQVTVFNPGIGASNALAFDIRPALSSLPPALISAGPSSAAQGSQHLQLTLRGTNFRPNASIVISPPLASVQLSLAVGGVQFATWSQVVRPGPVWTMMFSGQPEKTGAVVSFTVTVEMQVLDASWLSVTVSVTEVSPSE